MKKKICVIGAGLGGLSAAIRLANKGFEIDLYEQNSLTGGKASELRVDGFRFDTGPSLLTMPFVIEELFHDSSENIDEYIKLLPLNIICKYFYPDKTVINAYADANKFGKEIEEKTDDTSEALKLYLKYCENIYTLTKDLFLYNSPSKLSTYLNTSAFRALINLKKIDPFRTMHKANSKYFKDPKLVQLFDRYATYNGSDPYKSPATLNIIPHVEYNLGSYFPVGGIFSITKALTSLAEKKGVNISSNKKVNNIVVENKSVTGIKIDNTFYKYDAVISNVDVNYTFNNLINSKSNKESRRYLKLQPSFSGLVFYWGIKKEFPELETHNILFSSDYKREFDYLFNDKVIFEDPTIYIYISSKLNKNDAPAGKENWFVMINAPYIHDQDWEEVVKSARNNVINKINKSFNTNIEEFIETEKIMTPVDIQNKTGSYLGSIYGISSNDKFSAFMRQSNKSKTINNLYFCGGSAHPGGGIPLVILSGKIAAEIIESEFSI